MDDYPIAATVNPYTVKTAGNMFYVQSAGSPVQMKFLPSALTITRSAGDSGTVPEYDSVEISSPSGNQNVIVSLGIGAEYKGR